PSSGGFEYSSGRRKTHLRHGVAINVQHHARRAVHAVMAAAGDMPDPAHIGGKRLPTPTFSAKNKRHFGCQKRGMKKEFLHPLFAIGKTVPNKCQITAQLRI